MKLHDLRPPAGAHRERTRVGRGIAAGKGKTAGRGTKGQKARAGGSIPPWFEGGQTPLHMRIPKLRGFRNRAKVEYEVVNVGRIAALVAAGRLEPGDLPGDKPKGRGRSAAPITVNQEILRATGLVSTLRKPLKILGGGDVDVALFVVADAVTASARTKIEAAGGSVQLLEVRPEPTPAIGLEPEAPTTTGADETAEASPPKPARRRRTAATTEAPADDAAVASDEVDQGASDSDADVAGAAPDADAADVAGAAPAADADVADA